MAAAVALTNQRHTLSANRFDAKPSPRTTTTASAPQLRRSFVAVLLKALSTFTA